MVQEVSPGSGLVQVSDVTNEGRPSGGKINRGRVIQGPVEVQQWVLCGASGLSGWAVV